MGSGKSKIEKLKIEKWNLGVKIMRIVISERENQKAKLEIGNLETDF